MLALREWMGLLRSEYLEGYVRDGGSTVKFAVVPDDETAQHVLNETRRLAEPLNYLVAKVDASDVKVHLMHQLFHEVARQVPWESLAREVVRNCYLDSVATMPADGDLQIEAVARENRIEPRPLQVELKRSMEQLLNRKHELSKDFRYAMLWLCMAQVAKNDAGRSFVDPILQWLRGDLRLVSALKRCLIFRKIDRHNGRAMLSSLGAWCRLAGRGGLVLQLDMRQLLVSRRADAKPGTQHYSAPAVMDTYEVLRQVIDSTDDLSGVLCLVIVPPEMFEDEKRGVKVYKALYERVWPDVRLKSRANPLSALAALEGVA